MGIEKEIFNRTQLLVGKEIMKNVCSKKVIIFGVGGVGSWCAESLVRSGISHLTIVDSDKVCATNINRQLMATTETIDEIKVNALKKRLLEINPNAEINALQMIYSKETKDFFQIENYDYIIDCIDSLENKVLLILEATSTKSMFYSSMGAALKMDFSRIKTAEFWKINGCPLAAMLRKRMKRNKTFPTKKFLCVFSDEVLENQGENTSVTSTHWDSKKVQINGTMAHITAIFGFALAGLVMQDIYKNCF